MLRSWNGSTFSRRGRWFLKVRDNNGEWRQRATKLDATPENLPAARFELLRWRQHFEALPPRDPAEQKRAAERSKATARSRFKRARGHGLACECCGWSPRPPLGIRAINAHHIVPAAAGGADDPGNLAALCPNCHALAHAIYGRGAAPGRAELLAAIQSATA